MKVKFSSTVLLPNLIFGFPRNQFINVFSLTKLKRDSGIMDDDEGSALVSAITVLDNSRWGAREKRKERHRRKELLTSKKKVALARMESFRIS